jgi:hypothetical protein
MEDLGGAPAGLPGKSGGASAHHPKQVIKVARGEALRAKVTDAPQLNLPKSDASLRNLLAYKAEAGPGPAEALTLTRPAPHMLAAVVPPPPDIQRDAVRKTQLANPVVAPPPIELPRQDVSRRNLQGATVVVPPPVSAPVQATNRPARLTLPEQAVVAPQPEMNALKIQSRRQSNQLVPRVVPPPVELSQLRTPEQAAAFMRSLAVAPPPVEVQNIAKRNLQSLGIGTVVPPMVDVNSLHHERALQNGGAAVATLVVAPEPAREIGRASTGGVGAGNSGSGASSLGGTSTLSSNTGVVVSPKPGDKRGAPANSEKATLAMSPAGTAALGAGGEGGGSGIRNGSASGSASSGASSGASSSPASAGRGANTSDRIGSSPYPGPGGTGSASYGTARVPGVSVSGGSNSVTLPSFGAPPSAGSHSTAHGTGNGVTVVASPRAGGAMNFYGMLKGDRVYTIYLHTSAGMASMQFADPSSVAQPYAAELTAPQAIRTDAPSDVPPVRLVILCALDRSGALKNLHVLQSDASDFQKKILSVLPEWKFSPAFRGSDPVEVNVILGFGVDTK